jgi:hypothetical protein
LGEYSFVCQTIVDHPAQKVRAEAAKAIKQAGRDSGILLLYYFGHGVPSDRGDDLFLLCKDSDWRDETSMVRLGDLTGWMGSFKVPTVVLMLDCCHAGMISKSLRLLESYGGRYYLMGAVTAKDKALVDYNDTRPLGVFSKFLLSGFSNIGARVTPTRNVTFKSFFGFASSRTQQQSKQVPYSQDGGLAEEVFFKQSSSPNIVDSVRRAAPKKSLYSKLFALGGYLSTKEFTGVDELYALLKRTKPTQFLTPVKTAKETLEYELVSKASFEKYIHICRRLGILSEVGTLTLTPIGKRMFRRDGAQFNVCLYELLTEAWKRFSVSIADLEDVIAERLRRSSIPSGEALWFDMFLSKKLMMPKWLFNELLDLTGYTGALNLSRERTFFLASQADSVYDIGAPADSNLP